MSKICLPRLIHSMEKKQPNKRFVVSDESVNNYGFRVMTAGIDTSVFLKNPVGLWGHNRAWRGNKDEVLPICRWDDLKKQKGEMSALPVFDLDDEFAATIANKVDGGFINAASIGIQIVETSEDPKLMLPGQRYATITRCVLKEISIVDIPANSNAIALYDQAGEPINLSDEKCLQLAFGISQKPITSTEMDELNALALSLGLPETATLADCQTKIAQLKTASDKVSVLQAQITALQEQQKGARAGEVKSLLDAAVSDNRITADQRPHYEKLFDADFGSAKAILEGIAKPVKTAPFRLHSNKATANSHHQGKTFSQLSKENPRLLETLKANDLETFKQLYKAEFGREYKGLPKNNSRRFG